ncbi:rhamnulokinase [Photobacterium sp. ZSDE20]|uniref:Rhamnulokinase n=1 Tax=Photobacterium pectinilyticum TaxID=2906793 RepID=A0ABT1N5S5_9GAMM|nr:rhamnulokinase [Photobacterium sp. ZSDE20]MCQ1059897.1 rhamnulokinase [Photobacterium sp. ZSDE20]MDD1826086.1 rhamnulokinase [Photobacterium sp. ZSDE20]
MNYFLAVDIGASSGRHLLGYLKDEKIVLEEIYRFTNKLSDKNGQLCWDLESLFSHVLRGLEECVKIEKIPQSIGIDTWGVDFVLLDESEEVIGNTVSYRDDRTKGVMERICNQVGSKEIYNKTGIQFMSFNTLYQLDSIDIEEKRKACSFLMIPDYLNYLLTGEKVNEYTNATTTQMFNLSSDQWDKDLLEVAGVTSDIFGETKLPGHCIGRLKESIKAIVGFDCNVVLPATHDTGSAFIASVFDIEEDGVILSSGTWSLLGKELDKPIVSDASRKNNFTNEGGYDKRFRFLKNIMGLWIIQEVSRILDYRYSYAELAQMARESKEFTSIIDVNNERFFVSENMIEEIVEYCKETGQAYPTEIGEVCICVYRSLAKSYGDCINEMIEITGKNINKINIIGGGSKNDFLNELIEEVTGKEIVVGPVEATGMGNIIVQMLSMGEINNLTTAKNYVKNSI